MLSEVVPHPFILYSFLFIFCETVSHYVAQLASDLRSSCLSLLSAGITDMNHHTWFPYYFKNLFFFYQDLC
jgi:hypothetical protein